MTEFKTGANVANWIEANVPASQRETHKTAEAAAIWWLACQQAESYREMSMRELSQMLVDGLPALTLDDVTEELTARRVDAGVDELNPDTEIEADLRGFWGIEGG